MNTVEMNVKEFEAGVIAQDDDQDYSESGYVAVIHKGRAYLFTYSHCSCFGTWESISSGEESAYCEDVPMRQITPAWEGTPNQLVKMAKKNEDPDLSGRIISADDCDNDRDHLFRVYRQIEEWDKNGRPAKEAK